MNDHQDTDAATKDRRRARAILWTAIVVVAASWRGRRAPHPVSGTNRRHRLRARGLFSMLGVPDRDDPDFGAFFENVVAPKIDGCGDEGPGR